MGIWNDKRMKMKNKHNYFFFFCYFYCFVYFLVENCHFGVEIKTPSRYRKKRGYGISNNNEQ